MLYSFQNCEIISMLFVLIEKILRGLYCGISRISSCDKDPLRASSN